MNKNPPKGGSGVTTSCQHKYVLMDTSKWTRSESYNILFVRVDRFFCEKCLDEQAKERREYSRDTPEWYR